MGTATAGSNCKLLVVDKDRFNEIYHQSEPLRHLLHELKKTYRLPTQGLVEQVSATPLKSDRRSRVFLKWIMANPSWRPAPSAKTFL